MGAKGKIGLIGLAVMGANLARNLAGHGISTVVYNRSRDKTENFLKNLEVTRTFPARLLWKSWSILWKNRGRLSL
mgnify:CR=1 FL=1